MSSTSLLLADDHPVFLLGMHTLLSSQPAYTVIAQAENGQIAIEQIRKHSPDIAVLDIDMPYLTGIEVAEKIREEKLSTRIVILSYYWDEKTLQTARDLQVEGILLKQSALEEITPCLEQVRAGHQYIGKNCFELSRG